MEAATQEAIFYLFFLIAALALWKGGAPERYGVGVLLAMLAFQWIFSRLFTSEFDKVDPVSLLTDMIGTIGFGMIALQAFRIWPLWATSLQLLALSAHFARWADLAIPKLVYAIMRSGPTAFVMVALLVGTVLHLSRLKRLGFDRSWQDWSKGAARYGL